MKIRKNKVANFLDKMVIDKKLDEDLRSYVNLYNYDYEFAKFLKDGRENEIIKIDDCFIVPFKRNGKEYNFVLCDQYNSVLRSLGNDNFSHIENIVLGYDVVIELMEKMRKDYGPKFNEEIKKVYVEYSPMGIITFKDACLECVKNIFDKPFLNMRISM